MKPLFDDISNNLNFHKSMIEILIDYQLHIKEFIDSEIIMDSPNTQLFFMHSEIELIERIINCHHTHYKQENLDAWIAKQDNLKDSYKKIHRNLPTML
jgi:hypothetical protein